MEPLVKPGEVVVVTGATGFVAGELIRDLLEHGLTVRGTVRNPAKQDSFKHLLALPGAERLSFVAADLTKAEGWFEALDGAVAVVHTASPYTLSPKDPQRDLVDPAENGTRFVLAAAARHPSIRRVVLTSSMAAVTDEPDGRVLTEADWNEKSSLERNPYYFSKVRAERAAHEFMAAEKPGFDLVVINPFVVIGPSIAPSLNASNAILAGLITGTYPAIFDLTWGFVDVRDVAAAHRLALLNPAASGRYVCAADTRSLRRVVEVLREAGERGKLPWFPLDSAVGNAIAWLAAFTQPKGVRSYMHTHLGRKLAFDHGKIERELGLRFRDVDESIRETIPDLRRWGHLPKEG